MSILANNAGIARRAPFLDIDVADWQEILDVNLTGMFAMAQAFARLLVRAGRTGSIVNMASTNAFGGEELRTPPRAVAPQALPVAHQASARTSKGPEGSSARSAASSRSSRSGLRRRT